MRRLLRRAAAQDFCSVASWRTRASPLKPPLGQPSYNPDMSKTRLAALLLASSFAPAISAQDLLGKISCHAYSVPQSQNRAYTKKLWDGYELSLGPTRNSQGGGDECTAAIYNQAGHVVFRTT